MTAALANTVLVPSAENPDRHYVRLHIDHAAERVIVLPAESGARLPHFWPVWLRKLLAQKFDTTTYRTEISNNRLHLSVAGNLGRAITMAVATARELRALPNVLVAMQPPYRYQRDWHTLAPAVQTDSTEEDGRFHRMLAVAEELHLPPGYKLSVWGDYDKAGRYIIRLHLQPRRPGRGRRLQPPLGDVARTVELHFSLAAETGC